MNTSYSDDPNWSDLEKQTLADPDVVPFYMHMDDHERAKEVLATVIATYGLGRLVNFYPICHPLSFFLEKIGHPIFNEVSQKAYRFHGVANLNFDHTLKFSMGMISAPYDDFFNGTLAEKVVYSDTCFDTVVTNVCDGLPIRYLWHPDTHPFVIYLRPKRRMDQEEPHLTLPDYYAGFHLERIIKHHRKELQEMLTANYIDMPIYCCGSLLGCGPKSPLSDFMQTALLARLLSLIFPSKPMTWKEIGLQ